MAIIPDVPHVVVDIVVDGHPLPEYLDEDDNEAISPKSTTKYVECMPGSNFAIRTNITGLKRVKGHNSVDVAYYLDGQRIRGRVLRAPWTHDRAVFVRNTNRYLEDGSWKEREFVFTNLVTTEDGASTKPKPELKDLGMITVELYHAKAGKSKNSVDGTYSKVNVGQEKIHEKELKGQAISSQIKYSSPPVTLGEARSMSKRIKITSTKRMRDAFATFNFRYRSRSESSHKDIQVECLLRQRTCKLSALSQELQVLFLWKIDQRRHLLERSFSKSSARREEQITIKKEIKRERIEEVKRERIEAIKRERTEDDKSDDEMIVVSSQPATKKFKPSPNTDTIDLTED
ncbi:hypothetical protein E4T52_04242 [Aureobasidium sp. EXF-3400]|nr:hypothetical protein E4T51_03168 [Aureobasidium sp. EXF-12344]KAI4780843.1 hypothetical protein E4T52_04242 [Aureobasidium sp. EXF-3400]